MAARRRITVRRQVRVQVRRRITTTTQLRARPVQQPRPPVSSTRQVKSTVRPALAARSAAAVVGDNIQHEIAPEDRDYDVFISHASPDKDDVARPLAEALRDAGVSVWFDEFELRAGVSLRRSIDRGIAAARFGIVVLSPSFLSRRPWPEHELDGLVNGFVYGRQVLLPIWHKVTHEDVYAYSPSLADKVALSTDAMAVAAIAAEIAEQIRSG